MKIFIRQINKSWATAEMADSSVATAFNTVD